MPKLPVLSGHEIIKALGKVGFVPIGQKGSHIILIKQVAEGKKGVVVPNHKEVDVGTLLEIIRQAGLKREEFEKLLS